MFRVVTVVMVSAIRGGTRHFSVARHWWSRPTLHGAQRSDGRMLRGSRSARNGCSIAV